MKSVLLCEGPDDLWFSAYYLNKTAGWDELKAVKKVWRNYDVRIENKNQQVQYFRRGNDSVAIWCVAGKDSFDTPLNTVFHKLIADYPADPVDSVVILRDRDLDNEDDILTHFSLLLGNKVSLQNKTTSIYSDNIDGVDIITKVTPVIIPFDDCGAIETLLTAAIRDANSEGEIIVDEACKYIETLVDNPQIGQFYLRHEREAIKAKYAAAIAATNPGHSTGLFQDLVLSCPWETSEYVKKHFDVIVRAISST